ncbi:MAG TPA: hypothetical protein VN780_03110 [Candidatus Eisenbacteria bacterium]|jgi:hypothetical protein|nr:hypothetical protein [Candidatus Eisenbacteria bacterium]
MLTLARFHGWLAGLLAMAALVAPLPAQTPEAAFGADRSNHLRGTVINSVTNEPVPHALVLSPDSRFAVMTDDEGRFEFKFAAAPTIPLRGIAPSNSAAVGQPPSRPYALMARKPGFIESYGNDPVSIAPNQDEVTVPLTPEARVIGRVTVSGSDPADRIQVSLYQREMEGGRERWEQSPPVFTRSSGEFRFAGLAAGTYKLFTHEHMRPLTFDPREPLFGYPPIYYPATADFDSAAVIHLAAGETFQATLSPSRRRYYPVHFPMANVVNLQISVWPQGHPGPGYSLGLSSGRGGVEGFLPDGTYTVVIRSFQSPIMIGTTNFTIAGAPFSGPAIALVPALSIPVIVNEEMQHKPENRVSFSRRDGNQLDVNSKRPNYLSLYLSPVEEFGAAVDAGLAQPKGPEDTSLEVENVVPGRYRVKAFIPVGYAASLRSGNVNLLREPLTVAPGASPDPIEVTVRDDGAQVEGTIRSLAQAFLESGSNNTSAAHPWALNKLLTMRHATIRESQAFVYFVPTADSDGRFMLTIAGMDGKFQLNQVAPGRYRVLAFHRAKPELELATEDELRRYDSGSQIVEFAPSEKKSLQLEFASANE